MSDIDLAEFESRLVMRPLRASDYEAVVDLEKDCFPGQEPWSREHFESQIQHFPEGQICLEYDGKVVASSSSLIVSFSDYDAWHNWMDIADGGYIRNHKNDGDTLYGIEIMVDPEFRGYRLSRRLYDARKTLAREGNLRRIIIGGRIPGYAEHADELSASEYVEQAVARKIFDPVLTPQLANGFALQGLFPDYLPDDTASRGYATYLEWNNLDYRPDPGRKLRSVWNQRVSLVQYMMRRINSFDEFARQCEYYLDTAGDYRSDFVLFPELFTTQLLSLMDESRPGLAARRLAEFTPQYLELFSDLAIKYNVNVIGGSTFIEEEDDLYNVSFLFRRDGTIDKQYKLHVTPNEIHWWGVRGGSEVNVMDTDRGKIAIAICYDVEFPEIARIATAQGANILFVPFNTSDRLGYLRVRSCAQARAIENQIYVAVAGCAGNLPLVKNADIHYSQCGIFTPSDVGFARDAIAAESTPNIETVLTHDVDVELLQRNRTAGTERPWTDRRRDLYRVRWFDPDGGEHDI